MNEPLVELGNNTRINLSEEGINEGLDHVSSQVVGIQAEFDQRLNSIQNNCASVAEDVEQLKRITGGSMSNTGATRSFWGLFGKK